LHQVLSQAGCGLFYQGKDPDSLAHAVASLVAAPHLVAEMEGAAGHLFEAEFTSEAVCRRMEEHLVRVVQGQSDAGRH
jgi:hypothetical protein